LSLDNITNGFQDTDIYPINLATMKSKTGPSEVYMRLAREPSGEDTAENPNLVNSKAQLDDWEIKEIFEELSEEFLECIQYYVEIDGNDDNDNQQAANTRLSKNEQNQIDEVQENIEARTMEGENVVGNMQPYTQSASMRQHTGNKDFNNLLELPCV